MIVKLCFSTEIIVTGGGVLDCFILELVVSRLKSNYHVLLPDTKLYCFKNVLKTKSFPEDTQSSETESRSSSVSVNLEGFLSHL